MLDKSVSMLKPYSAGLSDLQAYSIEHPVACKSTHTLKKSFNSTDCAVTKLSKEQEKARIFNMLSQSAARKLPITNVFNSSLPTVRPVKVLEKM
jgi:hypothetical protein